LENTWFDLKKVCRDAEGRQVRPQRAQVFSPVYVLVQMNMDDETWASRQRESYPKCWPLLVDPVIDLRNITREKEATYFAGGPGRRRTSHGRSVFVRAGRGLSVTRWDRFKRTSLIVEQVNL